LTNKDLLYNIEILKDSINIKKYGQTKTYKWDLTSDGKRIYFIDKIFKAEGSWKIKSVNDSILTVRMVSYSGSQEEIIKFKKEDNSR
jgi:hypothetical protein